LKSPCSLNVVYEYGLDGLEGCPKRLSKRRSIHFQVIVALFVHRCLDAGDIVDKQSIALQAEPTLGFPMLSRI